MTLEQRFAEKYEVDSDGCWLWIASRHPRGYGAIRVAGKTVKAHRLSWELHRGVIPGGLHVLHRCDRTACVNPDHLFLGTHADNMADMVRKGRARGARGRWQKLDDDLHCEIRARYASEAITQRALAAEYGVAQSMVSYIVTGGRRKCSRNS